MRSVVFAFALLVPGVAQAHIHLLEPLSRTDNMQGDPQKSQHCGGTPGRTNRVTTFTPGQTITVKWAETIQHPGWFRISVQPNGETFRIPPASNGAGTQANNFPTENLTGMMDPDGTGSFIIKDRIPDGTLQTDITLPNMECTNCTLQFIQVMTNAGTYTTDAASDDIYFNCADITIAANAPDAGPQVADAGVDNGDASTGGNNNGEPANLTGGCSTSSSSGLAAGLALLGFAGLRRRRR